MYILACARRTAYRTTRMAKDLIGVLNGLRRVALALSVELGSELQSLTKRALPSTSLGIPNDLSSDLTFPDLIDESDVLEESQFAKEIEELARAQQMDPPASHRMTPTSPPGGTRQYHTMTHIQWRACQLHTSALIGCDTVVGPISRSKSNKKKQKIHHRARERAVPASRLSRLVNFGGLAAGLGLGTATEVAKRAVGLSGDSGSLMEGVLLNEGNIERIVSTLCRVRGAALKIGQMISIQDSALVPEQVQELFERVRNNADFMPAWQLERVLMEELGEYWKDKVAEFESQPLAAASIGQVHRAVLNDGRDVAMKIQYPGVGQSINSDIDNLVGVLKVWNILPEGLFLDNIIEVARRELSWEVDYRREAQCALRFQDLLSDDPRYAIPVIVPELSTERVLTAELIPGLPLDQCLHLSQDTRNHISECVVDLCLRELFEFRFMQTDPNWSNFYYNEPENKIYLLDFGASREYSKYFTDCYIKVIHGAATGDKQQVIDMSKTLGLITGYESKAHIAAYLDSVMILGEPFCRNKVFDFGSQDMTSRLQCLFPLLVQDQLTPPPEEVYSLHRKMAGSFLLCARMAAQFNCYNAFQRTWDNYQF